MKHRIYIYRDEDAENKCAECGMIVEETYIMRVCEKEKYMKKYIKWITIHRYENICFYCVDDKVNELDSSFRIDLDERSLEEHA